jgi:hypothetical protein
MTANVLIFLMMSSGPAKSKLPIDGLNSSMVGTGFTQEGLDLTYATVDVLSEMSWRTEPIQDLEKWFEDFATRRYGRKSQVT